MNINIRPNFRQLSAVLATFAAIALVYSLGLPVQPIAKAETKTTQKRSSSYFEENRGQQDARVKYFTRNSSTDMFLTATEAVYVVRSAEAADPKRAVDREEKVANPDRGKAVAVYMRLAGANQAAAFTASEQLEHRTNYFRGKDRSGWHTNIPNYSSVTVEQIYDGINMVWHGKEGGAIQYDFVVEPYADPNAIAWEIEGADDVRIDDDGSLLIETAAGTIRQSRPFTFQDHEGERIEVPSGFVLEESSKAATKFTVRFALGEFDRSKALTIDPTMGTNELSYSTFLGGAQDDEPQAIAVDSAGRAIVVGSTFSALFPTTPGSINPSLAGELDVIVSKLSPDGSSLELSTLLGGADPNGGENFERAKTVAIGQDGSIYIGGTTGSEDFPTTPGAFDQTINAAQSPFVAKLNASGSELTYSTFIGGSSEFDSIDDLEVDSAGNAFITGRVSSENYPTTPGAYDRSRNSFEDIFVTKIHPSGGSLVYSTYLGGTDSDFGTGIEVDQAGNAYVGGYTESDDYPTTSGAYDRSHNGLWDAIVTKVNPSGSGLVYSTYIGASGTDFNRTLAIDSSGNAYFSGSTTSPGYPTTAGAYDQIYNGNDAEDAIVTKLNASGTALVFSTFLGGTSFDDGDIIAVGADGTVFLYGDTSSSLFPTTFGAFDSTINGDADTFLSIFSPSGSDLTYSTYFGGTTSEIPWGMAIDDVGNVYLTGSTRSTDFPTTSGVYDTSYNGEKDIYIAKFGSVPLAPTIGEYAPTVVSLGENVTIAPKFPPLATMRLTVTGPTNLIGELTADPVTGIIRITNASHANIPEGTYPIKVKAFGLVSTATTSFNLTVNKAPFCSPLGFAPMTTHTVGVNPGLPVIGDFNNDGNQDVATPTSQTSQMAIQLGDGSGGLAPAVNYSTGTFLNAITVGDFNGDGNQDIAAAKEIPGGGTTILNGNGDGTFTTGSSYPVSGRGIATGDFNEDGRHDLVVATYTGNTAVILLGQGDGQFASGVPYSTGAGTPRPTSVVVADLNNDGHQDLLTTNFNSNTIGVLTGTGTGTFSAVTTIPVLSSPGSGVIGDFNNDGNQDFAFRNGLNTASVMLGRGDATFDPPINHVVGLNHSSLAVGDLNGDGLQDLAATFSSSIAVLTGDGEGGFSQSSPITVSTGGTGQATLADLDGDGNQDIVSTLGGFGGSTIGVLRRVCTGSSTVELAGRVVDANGFPVRGAYVTVAHGTAARHAVTNTFGYFRFAELPGGETVTLNTRSQRHTFDPRQITLSDNISDLIVTPTTNN